MKFFTKPLPVAWVLFLAGVVYALAAPVGEASVWILGATVLIGIPLIFHFGFVVLRPIHQDDKNGRTSAQRIVDTLQARSSGVLPQDFDEQMVADVDAMAARYEDLRLTLNFGEADRRVKTEFVARLLGD